MATPFAQSAIIPRAQEIQRRNKPKGFFSQLGEGIVGGLATAGGRAIGEQVFGAPFRAMEQAQVDKQNEFLTTELAAEAKRNNKNINDYIKQYRAAQDRSIAYGTSFDEEFANSEMFTQPAIAAMRKKDFIAKGAFCVIDDNEIKAMTLQDRIAEVKANRKLYDDIYNQAKGVRSETEFSEFLKRQAPKAQGLLSNAKSYLTSKVKGKTVGELAEQRIMSDERYQKSLSALSALNKYRETRNEGQFIKAINAIKLSEVPRAYYEKLETAVENKQFGKFFQDVRTTKVTNQLNNTVTVREEIIPGTISRGVSKLGTQVDVNDVLKTYTPKARADFQRELDRRIDLAFPNGVTNSQGKPDKKYDFNNYENYNTDDGIKANLIASKLILDMGQHKANYIDFDKARADAAIANTELKVKYGELTEAITSVYSDDVEEKNGQVFVRIGNQLINPDDPKFKNNARVIEVMEKYNAGQRELSVLRNFTEHESKIALGLEVGYITVKEGERSVNLPNEKGILEKRMVPYREALPVGALGFERDENNKIIGEIWNPKLNLTKKEKAFYRRNFEAWQADEVVRFDPREIQETLEAADTSSEEGSEKGSEKGATGTETIAEGKTEEIKERLTLKPPPDLDNISGRGGLLERDSRRKERERFNKILAEVNKMPTKLQRRKNPKLLENWTKRNEIYRTEGIPYDIIAQTDPNLYRMLASN